jgi:hypothetical protein
MDRATRVTRVLVTREERIALTEATATLDGNKAVITGYDSPYASVREIATGKGVEFAWVTVRNIVHNRDGEFHS